MRFISYWLSETNAASVQPCCPLSWQYMLFVQHNTMESLLERGEKLDDLVAKSEHLGNQSKAFYKTVSVEEPAVNTGLNIWWLLCFSFLTVCACVCVCRHGNRTHAARSCDAAASWTRLSLPFCFSYDPHHAPATSCQHKGQNGRRLLRDGVPKGRARKSGGPLKRDLSRLWLMGAEGVMGFGRGGGGSNFWIIFKLSKGKRRCGVPIPVEDLIMWRLFGDVLSKHHLMSFWVTWIWIVWFQRVLTRVVLLPQGAWQSQRLS